MLYNTSHNYLGSKRMDMFVFSRAASSSWVSYYLSHFMYELMLLDGVLSSVNGDCRVFWQQNFARDCDEGYDPYIDDVVINKIVRKMSDK